MFLVIVVTADCFNMDHANSYPDMTTDLTTKSTGSAAQPKLLDQVRARIRVKHYSIRTEDQYVFWIRRFIFFHDKRHPREMEAALAGRR
jgi:hypothetical protein